MRTEDEITKEFLDSILASMEGGVFTIDKNARITSFNRAAERITGFKKEEVLKKECYKILRSNLCKGKCRLKKTLETGKSIYHYDAKIVNKAGKEVPVNITTSALRSSKNGIIGGLEIFRDLTKHLGLWGKLRQERNRAQQYLNIAGVIIVAINSKGAVTLINKKGCDILGCKEEEIIGKNWFDICIPEMMRKEVKRVFRKLIAGNSELVEYYENPILTKSGEERIVAWHNTILVDEKGHIIGTLSSGEDITERKQAEEQLSQHTQEVDERIKELDCLYAVSRLLTESYKSLDEIFQEIVDLIPPSWQYPKITCARITYEDREFSTANFKETKWKQSTDIMSSGSKVGSIEVYYLKDKPVIDEGPFRKEERRLIDGLGRQLGAFAQRKQAEAELIRSEKLISVGQLAASVAHEVNNPLAGILVYIKLLLKKYKENKLQSEETEKQLLKVERETKRSSRIIRNLLDFSRQSEPSLRAVDLNKVVKAALSIVGHQINLENVKLEQKLDTQHLPVLADFDQIQQVLINIILNATQAMPDGGNLTITTSIAEGIKIGGLYKNTVRIDITDTGIGIPKENLDKLFTPFFSTKEKEKGSGLGLPVVHGIIERHKGKIEVDSEPNVGTTFTIYLEIMDEEDGKSPYCG